MFDGCTHAKKAVPQAPPREVPPKPQVSKPGVPSCSFVTDEDGNLIVDINNCRTLSDDSTVVVLTKSSLGRPIFLTHVDDQIYYALDSRCGNGQCTIKATGKVFLCPCDSSVYSLSGEVISGPATHPLRELPSLKNGDRIRITPKK